MRTINFYWPLYPRTGSGFRSRATLQRCELCKWGDKSKARRTEFIGCHPLISIQMRSAKTNELINGLSVTAPSQVFQVRGVCFHTPHSTTSTSRPAPWRWINNKVTTTKNDHGQGGVGKPGEVEVGGQDKKCSIIELTNHQAEQAHWEKCIRNAFSKFYF